MSENNHQEGTVGPSQHAIWMDAIQAGDESAWQEVYEYYRTSIYRFCSGYVKNHDQAEDIVQDLFIRMQERSHQFQRGRSLRSWLYGIARNACLDHLKKKKLPLWQDSLSSKMYKVEVASNTSSPMTKLVHHEERLQLDDALAALSEEQRSALILKHVEGLSRKEIAEALNTDVPRVKNLLYAAMNSLRKKCEKKI